MRIYTKAVYDYNLNLIEDESEWYEYFGPVELCKGDASKSEQSAADTQRAQQNQLAQQQLQLQQQQLAGVNAVVDPMIAAGGLAPGVESAMTSLLMNQLPQAYGQGIGALNQSLVGRGLSGGTSGAGGGGIAGGYGQLIAGLGQAQQQGLSNIQLQKQQALMNDLGLKLGIGAQYGGNIGTFNQGASNALNAGVTAANNVDQAQTSWMGPVFGALGGLGSSVLTGGMSNLGKGQGFFGCWIAAECFGGWDVPKVQFIRLRLTQKSMNDWKYGIVALVYAIFGRVIAKAIRKSTWLRAKFTTMFNNFAVREMDAVLNEAVNG